VLEATADVSDDAGEPSEDTDAEDSPPGAHALTRR
jgi:hypothetical protein